MILTKENLTLAVWNAIQFKQYENVSGIISDFWDALKAEHYLEVAQLQDRIRDLRDRLDE